MLCAIRHGRSERHGEPAAGSDSSHGGAEKTIGGPDDGHDESGTSLKATADRGLS
jgi:hypothetical protein